MLISDDSNAARACDDHDDRDLYPSRDKEIEDGAFGTRIRGRGLNCDSRGPNGFSNSIDSTRTMAFCEKQKFESFVVITIDNPSMAEQHGFIDSSSTWRFIGNVFQQALVVVSVEEDFQFHMQGGVT